MGPCCPPTPPARGGQAAQGGPPLGQKQGTVPEDRSNGTAPFLQGTPAPLHPLPRLPWVLLLKGSTFEGCGGKSPTLIGGLGWVLPASKERGIHGSMVYPEMP